MASRRPGWCSRRQRLDGDESHVERAEDRLEEEACVGVGQAVRLSRCPSHDRTDEVVGSDLTLYGVSNSTLAERVSRPPRGWPPRQRGAAVSAGRQHDPARVHCQRRRRTYDVRRDHAEDAGQHRQRGNQYGVFLQSRLGTANATRSPGTALRIHGRLHLTHRRRVPTVCDEVSDRSTSSRPTSTDVL
jgi:hypothetical protein